MDFVYMCRSGENEELRYSIRSVVKNAPVRNVWVIGSKPDWYSGNFMYVDPVGNSFDNVRANLKAVIGNKDISEDFVLMNDDFFIIKSIDSMKVYHGGLLIDRYRRHQDLAGPNYYANSLMKSDKILKQGGIEVPLNYELHVPMVINKTNLSYTIDNPASIRSYYGNMYQIGGEQINDVKIYSHPRLRSSSSSMENGTPFVSTEDDAFVRIESVIKEMFPTKSPYEND